MELGVEGARLGDLPAADTPDQAADRIAGPRHAAVGGGDRDRGRDQDRGGRRRIRLAAIAAQRKLRALRRIDHVGGGHFDHPADPLVSEAWHDLSARLARLALLLRARLRLRSAEQTSELQYLM